MSPTSASATQQPKTATVVYKVPLSILQDADVLNAWFTLWVQENPVWERQWIGSETTWEVAHYSESFSSIPRVARQDALHISITFALVERSKMWKDWVAHMLIELEKQHPYLERERGITITN